MSARDTLTTIAVLSTFLSACAEEPLDDDLAFLHEHDEESLAEEQDGLRPFHVAVFDHEPTEEEIEAEFREFQASIGDLVAENDPVGSVNPTGYVAPGVGQKLVRLDALTSNIPDAGTDAKGAIRFTGRWDTNVGPEYIETFIMDNPGVDDLNRNTTSVFYYLMNLGAYVAGTTQDKFLQGQIANVSTDGWHCSQLKVRDYNRFLSSRLQSLAFNQWVDSPTVPESVWLPATDSSWKSYN
ncbi:hypothetical protein [Paraliomyxa miuraensis]|uniref:hypothetical protein n=1 Tax=Paraliomyxa miuraensis TaxID=376150 RepID=UPI0022549D4F|nr:hypothetical protein [Paraliomyxa miuraensis]MCX4239435.1 hypothetical protein [Paraliomyxa miuraensis]